MLSIRASRAVVIAVKMLNRLLQLRAAIAKTYCENLGIEEDDIFVSDGAKSDISRLQVFLKSYCARNFIELWNWMSKSIEQQREAKLLLCSDAQTNSWRNQK
ncbi:unnamed protein product [Fraxinus pennsylvanica]|uniref:Uncharacterized protein n=1 Tax=Fraxinus pennsylvanica TaxID=56036 RepID=A0AAD1ZI72_9LAMI|nr:unnamed protein product [Fraxinus pennsylvanica]